MMLSWVVIAVWWATAMVATLLLPALAIVGGFAILLVGGNLWVERRAEGERRSAVYLGLVGHVFLLFVASQSALAVPPWPLFGVLFVLDLAILVAALFSKRGELHMAAVADSVAVVSVWVVTASSAASPTLAWVDVGLLGAVVLAAVALLAIPLSSRRGAAHVFFPVAAAIALVGVLVVAALACVTAVTPSVPWLLAVPTLTVAVLGLLARERRWHGLMLGAVVPVTLGTLAWMLTGTPRPHAHSLVEILAVSGAPYALWLGYPFLSGKRSLDGRLAYAVPVAASLPFFGIVWLGAVRNRQDSMIGVLPVTQAFLLTLVLAHLLRTEPARRRDLGRLAFVAGAALAFVTVAIPLQLEKQWITLGWALEAFALSALYRRVPHKGLLATAAGLGAAVVVRLSVNPAVLDYHPRGTYAVWNWYLYAYLVSASALLGAASLLANTDDRIDQVPSLPRVSTLGRAGATLLLFLLLNIEIADYWSTGRAITFNFSSGIAQDLTYTLGWALFAIALLVIGILRESRGARLTALVLLVVTVAKAFLHDLWRLGGLYRVGSFVGLALSLALVAVVLQRFVLAPDTKKP
jgi:uncharacterized membrane protein